MKFKFSECCTLDSKLIRYPMASEWLCAMQFTSIKWRRCKSLALCHRSPMMFVQWWNLPWIVIGKLQVSVSRSLEYLPALIVTRRSFSEISEKQNFFMKKLVCWKKNCTVLARWVRRVEQGMIVALAAKAMLNHSFTANDLMHGGWYTEIRNIFVLAKEVYN